MITMDTYKTPGGQSSPRDQKIFNLDQNSIEPHIEEIRTVFKPSRVQASQITIILKISDFGKMSLIVSIFQVIVEHLEVWSMAKCSNSKSINQLDLQLNLLVLLLNFLAMVDERHFPLLNIATKNNKKFHIVFYQLCFYLD